MGALPRKLDNGNSTYDMLSITETPASASWFSSTSDKSKSRVKTTAQDGIGRMQGAVAMRQLSKCEYIGRGARKERSCWYLLSSDIYRGCRRFAGNWQKS